MDCPICYDKIIRSYQLKNCSHVMCDKCYRQVKHAAPVVYPFVVETVKQTPIQCPLCRTKEDISVKPEDHPVEYMQWMELLFHKNKWGDSWYSVHTVGPPMKEWKRDLKYASSKVGRHRLKRIWRGSVH